MEKKNQRGNDAKARREDKFETLFSRFSGYYDYIIQHNIPEKFVIKDKDGNYTDPIRIISNEIKNGPLGVTTYQMLRRKLVSLPDNFFAYLVYIAMTEGTEKGHAKIAKKVLDDLEEFLQIKDTKRGHTTDERIIEDYGKNWRSEVKRTLDKKIFKEIDKIKEFFRNIYILYSFKEKSAFNKGLYQSRVKDTKKFEDTYREIFDVFDYFKKSVIPFNPFADDFMLPTVDIAKENIISKSYIFTPVMEGFSEITKFDMLTIFYRVKCQINVPYVQLKGDEDMFLSKLYTGEGIENRPNFDYTADPEKNENETMNTMKIIIWCNSGKDKNIKDAPRISFKTITWKFNKNQINFTVTQDTSLEQMTKILLSNVPGLSLTNKREKSIKAEFFVMPSHYIEDPLKFTIQNFENFYDFFFFDEVKFQVLFQRKDKLIMYYRLRGSEKDRLKITLHNEKTVTTETYTLKGTGEKKQYNSKTEMIRVKLTKGTDQGLIDEFSFMFSLMYYFYTFLMIINPEIPENLEVQEAERTERKGRAGEELSILMKKAPDLFVKGYANVCQNHKPTIIDEDEVEQYRDDGYDVLEFPIRDENGPTGGYYYFISEHENYPHPYVLPARGRENDLPNFHIYPWTVCCRKRFQSDKDPNYKKFLKGIPPEVKVMRGKGAGLNKVAASHNLLAVNSLLSSLLSSYTDLTPGEFKRYGTPRDPHSFIHAILIAINDIYYTSLLGVEGRDVNKHLPELFCILLRESLVKEPAEDDENIAEMNKVYDMLYDSEELELNPGEEKMDAYKYFLNVNRKVKLECCRQELYDFKITTIVNHILDPDHVFDPILYYRLLEELFEINIYVFKMPNKGDDISVGEFELPRNKYYHSRYENSRPTVLIMRSRINPTHFELCVESKDKYIKKVFPENMTRFCNRIMKAIQTTYTLTPQSIYISLYSQKNYADIFKFPMTGQYLDINGKCQCINFEFEFKGKENNLSVFIPPGQPLNVSQTSKFHQIDSNVLLQFLDNPKLVSIKNEKIVGFWYEAYKLEKAIFIPIVPIDRDSMRDVEETDIHPLFEKESHSIGITKRIAKMERDIRIIKELCIWLMIISELPFDEFIDSYLRVIPKSEEYKDTSRFYDLSDVEARFPEIENGNIEEALEYYQNICPSLIMENEIIMCNRSFANSIAIELRNYYFQRKEEVPRYISGLYLHDNDFNKEKNVAFFNNKKEMIEWIRSNVEDLVITSFTPFENRVSPIIFMNNIGNIYFIQPVAGGSLRRALNVSKIWQESRVNIGYNADELEDDYAYIEYFLEKGSNLLEIFSTHDDRGDDVEVEDDTDYLKVILINKNQYLFYALLKF